MKSISILGAFLFIMSNPVVGQVPALERFDFFIGEWSGAGSGFGNDKSKIESSFQRILNGKFIEMTNESRFDPTEGNPEGEHHMDKAYISFDADRKQIICRQFFVEGYVIRYYLDETKSNADTTVFVSEHIENMSGGKARWTIVKISETEFEDMFEVAFPEKDFICLGTNRLVKK